MQRAPRGGQETVAELDNRVGTTPHQIPDYAIAAVNHPRRLAGYGINERPEILVGALWPAWHPVQIVERCVR